MRKYFTVRGNYMEVSYSRINSKFIVGVLFICIFHPWAFATH